MYKTLRFFFLWLSIIELICFFIPYFFLNIYTFKSRSNVSYGTIGTKKQRIFFTAIDIHGNKCAI